jgi:hypothetical protein
MSDGPLPFQPPAQRLPKTPARRFRAGTRLCRDTTEPMWRQELGWTKVRTKPTQPGNALALVVDDGDPRAKVRHIAANRPHSAEFADIVHGALAKAKIGLRGLHFKVHSFSTHA